MQSTYPYKVYNTASPITHHQLRQLLPLLQIYNNKQNSKFDQLDQPDCTFHLTDVIGRTDKDRQLDEFKANFVFTGKITDGQTMHVTLYFDSYVVVVVVVVDPSSSRRTKLFTNV